MIKRLRQLFCVHWFDPLPDYSYEYSAGQMVCGEQRLFSATREQRRCSKCGLEETRVRNIECLGWQ